MDAQVLQVGLGDEGAHGVGHPADAQLQAGAVGDLRENQTRNGLIHLRSGSGRHLRYRRVVALHDHGNIIDMDADLMAAEADGHVLIHLHDHRVGNLAQGRKLGSV